MTPHETDKFTQQIITSIHTWVPGKLFSFTCTRPTGFRFTAGQFARLGVLNTLQLPNEPEIIWRAYSMVSSPFDEHLEFFSIVVPDGAFTSHLAQLREGDPIYIDKTAFGFLTTSRFESGQDLWLLASGTGVAPFLSILNDPHTWDQFENVCLAYSARTVQELAYQQRIQTFATQSPLAEFIDDLAQRFHYIPIVTREQSANCLHQRLTQLLQSDALSQHTGLPINTVRSRFMICGNPDMVNDVRHSLKTQEFRPARQQTPGEIAVENYW